MFGEKLAAATVDSLIAAEAYAETEFTRARVQGSRTAPFLGIAGNTSRLKD